MRPVRRITHPQRRRVFLGCEGESERGYGTLLSRLLEMQRQDVHLDVVLLKPGAGDTLPLVELALRRIADSERKRGDYAIRAVLLDTDRLGQAKECDRRLREIAKTARLRLIWQRPCHEAFLLRHLQECQNLRPPTADASIAELRRRWPGSAKGMSAMKLGERVSDDDVRRASLVEPDLASFLVDIGFV
jgi:hypothetical protein